MKESGVSQKQNELKEWLQKMRLSQNDFAAMYLDEFSDGFPPEEETRRFQELFKKQINRPSTKLGVIEKYLEFLFGLEKFKEVGYIRPQCCSDDILDGKAAKMMRELSKKLSKKFAP